MQSEFDLKEDMALKRTELQMGELNGIKVILEKSWQQALDVGRA
ncbi:hypothetical protein chiPu_0026594, partial [Chiloscyllium punctatum]|nr:hypothetical protein [Chiloscyllium punctatum]